MTRLRFFISIGLISFALFINSITHVQAQTNSIEQIGLSIVPSIVDVPLTPGVSQNFTVTATNITEQPLPVVVGVKPLVPLDKPTDNQLAERYDATAWFDLESNQLLFNAKESKVIDFTVSPPADAGPGGHYVQLIFRVLTPFNETELSSTKINPELTATVLFTVPGDIVEAVEVTTHPVAWISFDPQRRFDVTVANTGNSHVLISPSTIVTGGLLSGDSAVASLPGQTKLLLPHTEVTFPVYWDAKQPGIYKYEAMIKYGSPTQTAAANSTKFVVLPAWWILIAIFSALLIFGAWSWRLFKRKILIKPITLGSDKNGNFTPKKLKPHELDRLAKDKTAQDKSKR